jgi:hypothetical protein
MHGVVLDVGAVASVLGDGVEWFDTVRGLVKWGSWQR